MRLQRKEFIKLCGAALTSLTWISFFTTIRCASTRRKNFFSSSNNQEFSEELGKERSAVLYYASLAPSPHNTQPWYVKIINRDKWIIGADQSRVMKSTDPMNHRLILSIGLFAENLSLAAGTMGLNADIKILTENFYGNDILEVKLKKCDPVSYPLELITSRKTIKNGYNNKQLNNEHLAALSEPLKGHFFYFPRGNRHSECIKNEAVTAFRNWLDSDKAQVEHVSWIRISKKEAELKRDGITTEAMEIKGISGWFVRSFFSNEDFSGKFLKNESMKFTLRTAEEGAGFVIVTGYGKTVSGMIDLGRRVERMLLQARKFGIGIQPMTQIMEMESGREMLKANHSHSVDPQLVLRIGYVDNYPEPVALRRSFNKFVKFI